MGASKIYEILVSNEDTRDQVVRLLDESYSHPNVTIMAFASDYPHDAGSKKPVDKWLRSKIKGTVRVTLTRVRLLESPKSVEDKTFFKQLGFFLHDQDGEAYIKLPFDFEMKADQQQPNVSENHTVYHLDKDCALEMNIPPSTEIKVELFIK